jgi:hypothetical protein
MKKRPATRKPVRAIDELEAMMKDLEAKQEVLEGYAEITHELLAEIKARLEDQE